MNKILHLFIVSSMFITHFNIPLSVVTLFW